MMRRKVLVTGAAGTIAGLLLPALQERYDLTLLDVRAPQGDGRISGVHVVDLTDRRRDAYRDLFRGCDAVVHLGFAHAADGADVDARFAVEMANVQMAYNVYQVALEENVRRVVVASSNHAADYYEDLILDHALDYLMPELRPLSDNFYGWAKESYEHLGFVFATGIATSAAAYASPGTIIPHAPQAGDGGLRRLENVQIRIGGPRETDVAECPLGDLRRLRRALAVYISQRDLAQLFIRSIETEDIRDERGVPFQVFYGISGNSHAYWPIAHARRVIGYAPQDNSETRFAPLLAQHLAAAQNTPFAT